MIGPEGTATRVTGWLAARIPVRLRLLEARYELDPATLPDPSLVADHDTGPLAVEDYPALIVLPQRLDSLTLVEQATDTGAELYLGNYAVEVLAWLRADDYATTDQLRRRYVLALREALLERKQLAPAPAYGGAAEAGPFTIAPESLREDYGPVVTDEAHRTIAGVRLTVTVTVLEELDGPAPLGTVATPPAVAAAPLPADQSPTHVVTHPGLL